MRLMRYHPETMPQIYTYQSCHKFSAISTIVITFYYEVEHNRKLPKPKNDRWLSYTKLDELRIDNKINDVRLSSNLEIPKLRVVM
jgi:hypothetical protein